MTVVRVVNNYLDPLISPNGVLLANTDIVFQLVDVAKRQAAALFDALDGSYVVGNPVTATTDGAAYFTVNLWPNSRGEYATCYKVTLPNTNFKPVYIQVTEGEGNLTFLAARTNMEAMTPQTETIFGALLASITQALGTATSPVTDTTNGLMTYGDKIKLDGIDTADLIHKVADETITGQKTFSATPITPNDVRYYMDGQSGRPTLTKWLADQTIVAPYLIDGGLTPPYTIPSGVISQLSDLTSTVQAAVDANHGVTGSVKFPSGFFYVAGTVYTQKDTNSGSGGACWKPLHIEGSGYVKPNGIGRGGAGATMLYRPTDGDIFRVNLTSAGVGVTASGATLTNQFLNFKVTNLSMRSEPGVHVVGLRGFSTRATFRDLSFINMDSGWDFHDLDVNGADNYCDMWDVENVYFRNMGSHMFRQRNADASVFKNLRCESFQSSAVGGFRLWGGRGIQLPGLLVNGLPATSSYIGFIYYASQVVIQGGHFERNYCATSLTSPALASSHGFLLSGGNGCVISNNEFYNPDGSNATRPFILCYNGEGHQFGGNTFRALRDTSFDVAVFTPYTLVLKNTHHNADDSTRTDSVYFDATVDPSYGVVFKNHPLTADNATINTLFKAGGLLISGTSLTTITGSNTEMFVQNRSFSSPDMHALTLSSGTASNSAGGFTAAYVKPTINQTGTAGYYGFQVNVTETSTGSGAKKLVTAGKGGASYVEKFGVDSDGNGVFVGTVSASNFSGTHTGASTGTNTGDETTATIKTKLGITTLSGSNTGDQDLSGYALIASPTFTGTPAAPTAAADTTTTQLATTAFVLGQVATTTPIVTATGGTGVVGTSKKYARADHAHPKGDAVTVNGYGTSQSGAAVSCMVTDGNGNLGLGTTPDTWASANRAIQVGFSGALFASTSSTATSFANNVYDNGIARYRTSNAAALYQQSGAGHYWFNAPTGTAGAALTWALALSLDSTGALAPGIDNTQTCGSAAKRWSTLYAGTGTINTSDAREKTAVQVLTDAEISAASALSKEIGTYRFLSAIAEKGEAARFHVGMTVQRAIEIIQSFGLDPFKYGFICHDEWGADADTGTAAGDRYSFRPDELLLFIARGIEARLTVLENR